MVTAAELGQGAPTGYDEYESYWAIEYHQGGRQTFEVNLPLSSVPRFVAAPDPNRPVEGNRRVDVRHAANIAQYICDRDDGLIPTIVLRCPSRTMEFEPNDDVRAGGAVRFGTLRIPKSKAQDLHIVDGQHRVLGLEMATKDLSDRRLKLKSDIAEAQDGQNMILVEQYRKELAMVEEKFARIARERVTLQIIVVDSVKEFKQIFVDVNDNAKGVKASVVIRFDSTNPTYQATVKLADHRLFANRVETEKNIVGDNSDQLVSLANISQFVRAASFGISGRISRAREKELRKDNGPLVKAATDAIDRMLLAFPLLESVASGTVAPADARRKSPLARANTMRVLIAADWALRELGVQEAQIQWQLSGLADELAGPFSKGNRLHQASGNAFPLDAMAPGSRNQDLKDAVATILGFCAEPSSPAATWLERGHSELKRVGGQA